MEYYTYVLIRPDETPFYVGKGCGKRYLQCGNNQHAQRVAQQITAGGQTIGLHKVPAATEADAFAEEVRLITLYGRIDKGTGTLCNLTDGGDGFTSEAAIAVRASMTPEKRRAIAIAANAARPPEKRRAIGRKAYAAGLGTLSPEQLSVNGRKGATNLNALLTLEQRRELLRKARESQTTAERSANVRKGAAVMNALLAARRSPDAFSLDNLPSPKKRD